MCPYFSLPFSKLFPQPFPKKVLKKKLNHWFFNPLPGINSIKKVKEQENLTFSMLLWTITAKLSGKSSDFH